LREKMEGKMEGKIREKMRKKIGAVFYDRSA
jgi:hypothetical protein